MFMEKIIGRSVYNTVRDTKIAGIHGTSLFITSTGHFYLYDSEKLIQALEKEEAVEWVKTHWFGFSPDEIARLKRYIDIGEA
jgi:hypothetical protein